MEELAHTFLAPWESFYVIVGSSAAALISLQFIVIVLISGRQTRSSELQMSAFATPNVVHFCASLLVAMLLSAPWHTLNAPRIALTIAGVSGLCYAIVIARRASKQTGYQLVLEDWVWHTLLPGVAYGATALAGVFMQRDVVDALFVFGSTALLLLFVGIHNAWDTVTYVATGGVDNIVTEKPAPKPKQKVRR